MASCRLPIAAKKICAASVVAHTPLFKKKEESSHVVLRAVPLRPTAALRRPAGVCATMRQERAKARHEPADPHHRRLPSCPRCLALTLGGSADLSPKKIPNRWLREPSAFSSSTGKVAIRHRSIAAFRAPDSPHARTCTDRQLQLHPRTPAPAGRHFSPPYTRQQTDRI